MDDQHSARQQPPAPPADLSAQPGYPPAPQWPAPPPGYVSPGPDQPGPGQPGYGQAAYAAAPGYAGPGYTAPGYGQPGYVQPGYGAPGYMPPGGYPPGAMPPGYGAPPYSGVYAYGNVEFGGFWVRFFARLIDGLVLILATIGLAITIVGILAIPFLWILYFPWMWMKRGGTLGQRWLGLRVVRAADLGPITGDIAIIRALVMFFLSGMLFGLGYIWVAFEPRKRSLHDMLAGTVVIHVR